VFTLTVQRLLQKDNSGNKEFEQSSPVARQHRCCHLGNQRTTWQ